MILPTKHIRSERALIGVGAEILRHLSEPMTVSRLWDVLRERRSISVSNAPLNYTWFILSLDFLFMIKVIEFHRGVISRADP